MVGDLLIGHLLEPVGYEYEYLCRQFRYLGQPATEYPLDFLSKKRFCQVTVFERVQIRPDIAQAVMIHRLLSLVLRLAFAQGIDTFMPYDAENIRRNFLIRQKYFGSFLP